jgi:hypothetical protein
MLLKVKPLYILWQWQLDNMFLEQRSRLPLLMLKADGLIYFVVERIFGEENKYWPDNWRHDTQHDDIQHNDNEHKRLISDTQHNDA